MMAQNYDPSRRLARGKTSRVAAVLQGARVHATVRPLPRQLRANVRRATSGCKKGDDALRQPAVDGDVRLPTARRSQQGDGKGGALLHSETFTSSTRCSAPLCAAGPVRAGERLLRAHAVPAPCFLRAEFLARTPEGARPISCLSCRPRRAPTRRSRARSRSRGARSGR